MKRPERISGPSSSQASGVETVASARARVEYERDLGPDVVLKTGLDGRVDDFDLETDPLLINFQDYSALFPARTEILAWAH